MKILFDKTIWDVSELSEVFQDKRLLKFLNKYQGIRSNSITKAIEQARDKIGDGDLIDTGWKHFYPDSLIVVDDLYAICLEAAVNRRCHFRFVPYRVRVIGDKKNPIRKKVVRIKGRKIAFIGGTGPYTKEEVQKAVFSFASFASGICQNPDVRSMEEKTRAPDKSSKRLSITGIGKRSFTVTLLTSR